MGDYLPFLLGVAVGYCAAWLHVAMKAINHRADDERKP
jgi:hypothetical protein